MIFFSPLMEDFMRFGLLSCLLPYSVSLCVVPLLECTNSINAATGKKRGINLIATSSTNILIYQKPISQIPYTAHQGIHTTPCRISPCQSEETSGYKVQQIPANKIIQIKTVQVKRQERLCGCNPFTVR